MTLRFDILLRAWWGLVIGAFFSNPVVSNETIAVTVYDFPPDIINSKTEPAGPLIDKVQLIMKKADLSIQWVLSSLGEESVMLTDGSRPFCTTGRIYSDMRVQKDNWVFLPYILHTISGNALLIHEKDRHKFQNFKHISEVFNAENLTGVFIRDVSYGQTIDSFFNKYPDRFNRSAASTDQVIAMVASQRANYTVVTLEYWRDARKKNPDYKELVNLGHDIELFDQGNVDLHLACSNSVPRHVLSRLEVAMKQIKLPRSPEVIHHPALSRNKK